MDVSEAEIKPKPASKPGGDAIIEAVGVEKSYPQGDGTRIQVVGLTNLSIEPGKIVALLGPSGCGKSTLLRMLTGLSQPSSGTLLWHGKPLDGQMPNVAIVFQSFALFPWLTVLENVEAPLEAKGVPPVERHKRALRTLDTVGLDGFETAYPKELSGGMKQRVGFARARRGTGSIVHGRALLGARRSDRGKSARRIAGALAHQENAGQRNFHCDPQH